jgi:flagellar basal-body rod modification protein FlgD
MSTQQLSSTTTSTAAGASINNGLASIANNYQTFLSLLTTQLANQDPTSPMDTSQFTSQLTQMTGVEQQLLSNQLLQQLVNQSGGGNLESAIGMIGKNVTINGDSANLTNGTATWTFSLPSTPSSMTVSVVNASNDIIWTGPVTPNGSGAQTFTWDGKDMSGNQQANGGTYTLKITATDANGQAITADTTLQGTATAVQTVNGQTMVTVGGAQVPLSSIIGVSSSSGS